MSKLVGIVGPSSTGKSASLRNLDPKATYIINVLDKDLPFKGYKKYYNTENKNIASLTTYNEIIQVMKAISESRPEIKQIVLDDIGFVMSIEFFKRSKESGYNKFAEIGEHMFQIINTAKALRDDLTVIFMFHEDVEFVEGQLPRRKIKTIGRMLDDKFDPQALMTVLLYTHVEYNKDGSTYHFITNRDSDHPAKSPMGMFKDRKIDNDMKFVIKTMNEYYEG